MKVGDIIDGLGVELAINGEDLVAGAVVIAKVVEEDGSVRMSVGWSDGMSWVERLGLVSAAAACETPPPGGPGEETG